jgi:predicted metal-dependent hydrolase
MRSLAEALEAGVRLFDDGHAWDAHEAWEERWRIETNEDARLFLQALIQIAAAFHKSRVVGDAESAARLFGKARAKLDAIAASSRWSPSDLGIDLDALCTWLEACSTEVAQGPLAPRRIPRRWS